MTGRAPAATLRRARQVLADRAGLALGERQDDALSEALCGLARDLGHRDADSLLAACDAAAPGGPLDALACRLRVGETHVFRTRAHFDALQGVVFPDLLARRAKTRRLRCWSAGCATGEETWSAAFALTSAALAAGVDLATWDAGIVGTDLDAASLECATAGEYGEYSFRGVDALERARFFEPGAPRRWRVRDAWRPLVRFARHDLVRQDVVDAARGADVILCRNVLMYLTPEAARVVLQRLHDALAPDGWLIVGAAEHGLVHGLPFELHALPECMVYRKAAAAPSLGVIAPDPEVAAVVVPAVGAGPASLAEDPVERALATLEQRPEDAESCLVLGRLAADRGSAREAEAWLRRAAELRSSCAESRYLLALLARSAGRSDEALRMAEAALDAQPRCVMALELTARVRREIGDADGAAAAATAALRLLESLPATAVVPLSGDLTAAQVRALLEALRAALAPRRAGGR